MVGAEAGDNRHRPAFLSQMPDRQQDEQHHKVDGAGGDIGSRHILRRAAPGEENIERYDEEAYRRAARDMVGGEMHRREGLPDRADQIETARQPIVEGDRRAEYRNAGAAQCGLGRPFFLLSQVRL